MVENSNASCSRIDNTAIEENEYSIECFQNYTAAEVFVQGLAGLVDQQDVESMIRAQKQILQRFEKTNEMLSNCNNLSVSRLKVAGQQFKSCKQMLLDIRKDLDYSFKRIHILKDKLRVQHPEAFSAAAAKLERLRENEDAENKEESVEAEKIEPVPSLSNEKIKKTEIESVQDTATADDVTQVAINNQSEEINDSSESGSADSCSGSGTASISTSDTA